MGVWDVEMVCEPAKSLADDTLRDLARILADRGMEVWWGPGALRLRFVAAPDECRARLAGLSRDLAWIGLPVRLYQLNSARPVAATERLTW